MASKDKGGREAKKPKKEKAAKVHGTVNVVSDLDAKKPRGTTGTK
jgi:hypothetical protein